MPLPSSLPDVPGWLLDAHYAPAGSGRVGGDWYDSFAFADGRVAIVLGDVAGHGLEAAATMAQLQNALRAHLFHEQDPGLAFTRLDHMMRHLLSDRIATAVCGVLDPATNTVAISHAGHHAAVVVRGDSHDVVPLDRDPLLGIGLDRPRHVRTIALDPGDAIVLFSDGLIERRRSTDITTERVAEAVRKCLTSGRDRGCATAVANDLVDDADDDVTVLLAIRT